MKNQLKAIATASVGILAISACGAGSDDGEPDDLSPVTLTLQWVVQAQFAGFIAALDEGYYEEEGIDLTINPGGPDVNNLQLLIAGSTDLAVQSYGNVLSSVDQGAELTAVGSVFERPGATLVYYTDNGDYSDPASWSGLTVGNWNGFSAPFWAAVAKNGMDVDTDVTIANQAFDMNAFISGEYDMAEAMTYNEYAQALAGSGDREIGIVDYSELGTAVLEDTIVGTSSWIEENPELVEGFLRASIRGWIYCRDNAESCVQKVLEYGTALPENYQTWQMNEVNKLLWPSTEGALMSTEESRTQSESILFEYGVVSQQPDGELMDTSYWEAAVADLSEEDLHGEGFTAEDLDPVELFQSE